MTCKNLTYSAAQADIFTLKMDARGNTGCVLAKSISQSSLQSRPLLLSRFVNHRSFRGALIKKHTVEQGGLYISLCNSPARYTCICYLSSPVSPFCMVFGGAGSARGAPAPSLVCCCKSASMQHTFIDIPISGSRPLLDTMCIIWWSAAYHNCKPVALPAACGEGKYLRWHSQHPASRPA